MKLNTEVKNVETLRADEVIVATGAVARTIPGSAEHAMDAVEYLLARKRSRRECHHHRWRPGP